MITRTLDVPDELGSVNALEPRGRAVGVVLLRELTATLRHRLQEQPRRCLPCGSRDVERCGHQGSELLTALGSVELSRQRVPCRRDVQPAEGRLAEGAWGHRATWLVQALICLAGASRPDGDAAVVVDRMRRGAVRHEQIRRVASAEGERVAQALAAPVFEAGEEEAQGLNVALDGDGGKSRDHPEGMEATLGAVYPGGEAIGRDRRRRVPRRDAATCQGAELLGKLGSAQASKLGGERISRLRLLGEGATGMDTLGDEPFPRAKRELDLWHLERHVRRGLKAAIDAPAVLTRQGAAIRQLIRCGQGAPVLAVLWGRAAQKTAAGEGWRCPRSWPRP